MPLDSEAPPSLSSLRRSLKCYNIMTFYWLRCQKSRGQLDGSSSLEELAPTWQAGPLPQMAMTGQADLFVCLPSSSRQKHAGRVGQQPGGEEKGRAGQSCLSLFMVKQVDQDRDRAPGEQVLTPVLAAALRCAGSGGRIFSFGNGERQGIRRTGGGCAVIGSATGCHCPALVSETPGGELVQGASAKAGLQ